MRYYQTVTTPYGEALIKPWIIAVGPNEIGYERRRVFLHGGGQIVVDNTPENMNKLLERPAGYVDVAADETAT